MDPWLPAALRVGRTPLKGHPSGPPLRVVSPFPQMKLAKEQSDKLHLNLRLQKGIYHALSPMGEGHSLGWGGDAALGRKGGQSR